MADQLITGNTLIEKESRSVGNVPIGSIVEFDETYSSVPEGFAYCDGSTLNDARSVYNGIELPNFNTNYLSIPGSEFKAASGTLGISYNNNYISGVEASGAVNAVCSVNLPQGATITKAKIYGSSTGNIWTLKRAALDTSSRDILATASHNTEDETISNGVIDNETYNYIIETSVGTEDTIRGAKITYTPRKKYIIRVI